MEGLDLLLDWLHIVLEELEVDPLEYANYGVEIVDGVIVVESQGWPIRCPEDLAPLLLADNLRGEL